MPFASARRVIAATALTTTLVLAGIAGPAFADYPVVPAFLSMCPGATGTGSFPIEARRADFNPPNFQNGETVTFTLSGSPSVNVGSGTATITDGDLTLPADWTSNPFGVYAPDKGAMTISYTAPSDATSSTFVFMEVYLNASGNMGYDSFSEPEFVDVFIEDCAPPPTPTPTPSPSPLRRARHQPPRQVHRQVQAQLPRPARRRLLQAAPSRSISATRQRWSARRSPSADMARRPAQRSICGCTRRPFTSARLWLPATGRTPPL